MSIFDVFSLYPWAGFSALFVFGLCIGSFSNVVIYRLPLMEKLALAQELGYGFPKGYGPNSKITLSLPASRCSYCGHKLAWYENIPVLSYVVLRGKCSVCDAPYGMRYALIEMANGLLFSACALAYGFTWQAVFMGAFGSALLILAVIDADTMELPDLITKPLMWAGILASMLGLTPAITLEQSVLGAVSGYLAMWSLHRAFLMATGKDALGQGDFKLVAAFGAWLGWLPLTTVLLVGSSTFVAWNLLKRWHYQNSPDSTYEDYGFVQSPFGPWLVLGCFAGALQLLVT